VAAEFAQDLAATKAQTAVQLATCQEGFKTFVQALEVELLESHAAAAKQVIHP